MDMYSDVKSYFEGQWQKVIEYFGGDERLMVCAGLALSTMIPFFVVNSFYMVLDVTGKPKCLMKFKIQKEKNSPVPMGIKTYVGHALFATLNEVITCFYYCLFYPVLKARGVSALNPLPDIWVVIIQLYLMNYVDEVFFYYGHRLLHWTPIYKRFHKQHHKWTAPISVNSSNGHPVDLAIEGFLPLFMAILVSGCHLTVACYYLVRGQISTLVHHSGYHFPFCHSPQFHDFHHYRFNECYGTGGLLDSLHGTDKEFKKSVQCKRDFTFYCLEPIDEQVPDQKQNKE